MRKLAALLKGKRRLLIIIQDFPDPDAMASAAALHALARKLAGVQSTITYSEAVGRSENQAMIKHLGIRLRPFDQIDPSTFDAVAMVDAQPGTGNTSTPPSIRPDILIDHHLRRHPAARSAFTDIRTQYGATSTILFEYLHEAHIQPDMALSTALFYGIWSDTQDIGRKCGPADLDALLRLYQSASSGMLREIRRGKVPRTYFQNLAEALSHARTYGRAIVTGLGQVENPDMIAEVADLLLRNESSRWALCYGFRRRTALFSLRTSDPRGNAGRMAHRIAGDRGSGGGHVGSAGGQVLLIRDSSSERRQVASLIVKRFLQFTHASDEAAGRLIRLRG